MIDLANDLYGRLRERAATERTSIRALITEAVESQLVPKRSRRVTGPMVAKKARLAPGSPDKENPYNVLFA